MSLDQKNEYIMQHKISPCHDTDFAYTHEKETMVIDCEDKLMVPSFCNRFKIMNPKETVPLDDYVTETYQWLDYWPKQFGKRLDISDVFTNENFLEKLDIDFTRERQQLLDDWKKANKKYFN